MDPYDATRELDHGSEAEVWYIVPEPPGNVAQSAASFRRWNIVIITILAGVVLGLFLGAVVPKATKSASALNTVPIKIHKIRVITNPGI
jgi:uncharacterized membrane protein YraQ (UPF0718 family)